MKNSYIYCLLALSLLLSFNSWAQQKAMFTQYMFNGLAINPAYSSLDEALNVTAVSRHQWTGFKGAPNTQSITFHTPVGESNTSIGFIGVRDQIGEVISETGGFVSAAQKVQLNTDTYLSLGINAGVSSYTALYSDVVGRDGSLNDPTFADNMDGMRGNFGFGVMLFSEKFYAGISSPYFFYRDLSNASSARSAYKAHYMFQAGLLSDLGEHIKFKPNMLVKYVNGAPLQIDLNVNFLLKEALWIGASWRSMDSFDALAQVEISPALRFGYSYDFTTTRLSKVEKGTHEVMLTFRFGRYGQPAPKCYF